MDSAICPICYEPNLESVSLEILECEHAFCTDCIRDYIIQQIHNNETEICCPYDSCHVTLTIDKIKDIIPYNDELLEKYSNSREIYTTNVRQISICPTCKFLCKKSKHSNKVYCKKCHQDFCFVCLEQHDYFPGSDWCENQSGLDSTLDSVSQALGSTDVKLCPVCKITIQKEEGCSAIKCKNCKIKFCWDCLRTNHMIKNLLSHNCKSFAAYRETNSGDEYRSGSDYSNSGSDE